MSLRERRARERAQMKAAIMEAAVALASEEGPDSVSMRKIAERIEYGAATLYEYFPTKRDLLSAVAREGFARLGERMRTLQGGDPRRRLLSLAECAWTFAFENPALYEVMHSAAVFPFGVDETPAEARSLFMLIRDALGRVQPAAPELLNDKVDMLWAAVSGMILLARFGRIAGGHPRAKALLDRLINELLDAWKTSDN